MRVRRVRPSTATRPTLPADASSVGHAEVVLGLADIELAHCRQQSGGVRWGAVQLGELLGDECVLQARPWNHVENALPDLVEALGDRAPATLEQCLELRWTASAP